MSTLNQDIHFDQLPDSVRHAFSGSVGAKVLLTAGTLLFRFSGHANISSWWSEASQLSNLLLSAKASGQSLFQYIRNTTAVLRQWDSGMNNLIVGKLNRSVYAFRGTISPQNEASRYMNSQDLSSYKKRFTKPVFFGGGNGQVYINGIKEEDITIIVPVGTVNTFDKIDDIIDFLISYNIV